MRSLSKTLYEGQTVAWELGIGNVIKNPGYFQFAITMGDL